MERYVERKDEPERLKIVATTTSKSSREHESVWRGRACDREEEGKEEKEKGGRNTKEENFIILW